MLQRLTRCSSSWMICTGRNKPSLLLLEHLARRLDGARILVVGTYRDVELDRRHPLSEVIAGLRRERLYERILVRGLDAEGVRAMLAGRAMTAGPEQPVNPALARALHEQTEGNPFFIEEIILHLVEIGALYRKGGQWQIRPPARAARWSRRARAVWKRTSASLRTTSTRATTPRKRSSTRGRRATPRRGFTRGRRRSATGRPRW